MPAQEDTLFIVVFWLMSVEHVGVYTFPRGPLCAILFTGTTGPAGFERDMNIRHGERHHTQVLYTY